MVVDMLHCPMRMNEKVLFLLYYATLKSCGSDLAHMKIVPNHMTAKIRLIGNLSSTWSHTFETGRKDKKVKLLPFKLAFADSKNMFNYDKTAAKRLPCMSS